MRNGYGRFVPGASGNPGGRPRGTFEMRAIIRTMAPRLIEELEGIVCDHDKPTSARVQAAAVLLGHGFGRPGQAQPVKRPLDPQHMSDAELAEVLLAADLMEEEYDTPDEPADGGEPGEGR